MNRRTFLHSPPVPGVAPGWALPSEPDPPVGDLTLIRVSRRAMATTFEIALPYGTPDAVAAAEDALDLIDDLEDQLTVYRDHSEVCSINAQAATAPVEVEPKLFDLLSASAALTRDTAGAFDIATGAVIKAWGFYRRQGRIPTPVERMEAMAATGMRHVLIDAATRSVKFRRPGLELNLGAIGKGYALDRAAELLRQKWGVRSALLQGGGSSVYALGTPPGQLRGWGVAVRHPHDDARTLGTVWLADQGFGTSAATFQYFEYNGRKYGHLLDPRTGWPAVGVASASAVAPTAAAADALSTAFFVLGATAAAGHCQSRPGLGTVVLPDGPESAVARPLMAGLPATRYDPPAARFSGLETL